MLLDKKDLSKVRFGLYRCQACGTYYDPTYGPCPGCVKKFNLATAVFAIVALLFLLLWLPLEVAQAQVVEPTPECWTEPDGTPVCISETNDQTPVGTLTPFVPTATPLPLPTATNTPRPRPTFTSTPIVITPVNSCLIEYCLYMPMVRK